jgi:hypothetical protein
MHRIEGVQQSSLDFSSRKEAEEHGLYVGYKYVIERTSKPPGVRSSP